jgi:hypothetical protein
MPGRVGCTNAFMQLFRYSCTSPPSRSRRWTWTGGSLLPRPVRQLDPAAAARAPGVGDGCCSARWRPAEPARGGRGRCQQPLQALGPDCADPAFGIGVGVRRLHRRDQHLSALRPEHVVEGARELRVAVAQDEAQPPFSFAEHHRQVASLLGDPTGVGGGGHPGQVDPAGVQLDKAQHIQPLQPDRV